jgi:cis-L-3-hydroxyproline dehydratase
MKITAITAWAQWQPFVDGTYTCSGGRSAAGFDSTLVRLQTDAGLTGWGEYAPLGSFYDPAFVGGAREGIRLLAPLLVGADPRIPDALVRRMDLHLNGHPYAKSALDMACHDIAAQAIGLPLAEALGGRHGDTVPLYRSVAQAEPAAMAAKARAYVGAGYRRIQIKVGLDVADDIERMHQICDVLPPGTVVYADANAAWRPAQAREFLRATRELAYTFEQPCASFDENANVRSVCDRPLVLDESIDSLQALLRAQRERLVDGITIKIARVGGVTKARLIRDVAVDCGLGVTIEDTGGAQIDTAAMAHLSLGVPTTHRTHTCDFHHWVTVANARCDLPCEGGRMGAPLSPGLGVTVDPATFGKPWLELKEP